MATGSISDSHPEETVNQSADEAERQSYTTLKNPRHSLAEKKGISPRQAQIENYHANPDQFSAADFGDKILHFVIYEDSNNTHHKNFPDEKYDDSGGIVAFQGDKLVWESKIASVFDISAKLKDFTGDGVPEVAVYSEDIHVTGCHINLSVYRWTGSTFVSILPEGGPGSYVCDGDIVGDIDNDGVYEFFYFKDDLIHTEDNPDKNRDYIYKKSKVIYKFNGQKYYLWDKIELPD